MTRHHVVSISLALASLALTLFSNTNLFAAGTSVVYGHTASIGNGFTAGNHPAGSHFHSSNLDDLPNDNPPINLPGVAEVGGFFGEEEVRGISEFEVGGPVSTATLSFEVLDLFAAGLTFDERGVDGLFNQGPYEGMIDLFAYTADHIESLSDYQVPPLSEIPVLSVEVTPLVVGGDEFSADVTSIYNQLSTEGQDLGIRFQMRDPDPDAGAITFTNVRLTLQAVPEPNANFLFLLGLVILLRFRRT